MTSLISAGNSPAAIFSIKFLSVVPPPEMKTAIGSVSLMQAPSEKCTTEARRGTGMIVLRASVPPW
jgi:hypothetical protein